MKRKILYVEGSPYANYPADPEKNVGGSIISLYYLLKSLNGHKYSPSLFLFYDSCFLDRIQGFYQKIIIQTKEYRRGTAKKPVHVFFSRDQYSFLSYMKMFFLRVIPSAKRMYSLLKRECPDIVHCNNSLRMNMDVILASRLAGIPCVCHVRSHEKLSFINKRCAGFVDYFVCTSEAVRNNYLEQGIKKEKLVVIPNGLDIQDFPIPVRQDRAGGDFIVSTIGRMVEWKGHEMLLEAIPHVIREKKNVQFWFVGDGKKRAELEEKASALNIGQHTKFQGFAQDIRPVLSDSDLVVHTPTRPEPFGRVVIEAMAMQKPVIATNLGGPSEIITDGQDGILIEPGKPDRLAEAVLQMLDNPERRQRIGKAARKTVEEHYDSKNTAESVERLYASLF